MANTPYPYEPRTERTFMLREHEARGIVQMRREWEKLAEHLLRINGKDAPGAAALLMCAESLQGWIKAAIKDGDIIHG